MRALVFWADGLMLPVNLEVKDMEHAAALEVCWRKQGVQLFDTTGKVVRVKPLLATDQIVFSRVLKG